MKEYQAPQIDVVVFEVNDIVTAIKIFDSSDLGEWDFSEHINKANNGYDE